MTLYREISELPPRLYAIGDIHGCNDELLVMLDHLKTSEKLTKQDVVLFIGDYIDRGPRSRQVIETLLEFKTEFPETIFLKGNHEDMLLGFLGFGGRDGGAYLFNGGEDFLASYDLKPTEENPIAPSDIAAKLPPEHVKFFRSLESYVIAGQWVFAHAGVNPLRDLRHQIPSDLFWIRDEFIQNMHYFQKTVIFGHTPYEDVMFHLPYKIGIDTGLVYGNRLTCIEVRGKKIFQVNKGAQKVQSSQFPEKNLL